jgi:sugar phosphate isomerase/epimerase
MASTKKSMSRRDFVAAAAGAAGILASSRAIHATTPASSAAEPKPTPPGRPRIGCTSWCFHSFEAGADPSEAIDIMGSLGFEGTELIINSRQDFKGVWADAGVDKIRKKLEQNKLEVAQFVMFQPVVEGLSSLDPEERKRNLDHFEEGCRVGKKLGAPMVNVVAQWPRELKGPSDYLPRYYELAGAKPGDKFHIDIAPGFDWDRVWAQYVETTKACLQRAKAHGLKFSIEQHTHCIVPDASSFLRLWDAVEDPDLGYNMDVGWTLSQREYPPLAIHKLKRQLMNLHMRDIDGLMRSFVLVGEGVMDFKAIAETLIAIGFHGFLSIEQDKHPGDMKATCARFVRMMKEYLGA